MPAGGPNRLLSQQAVAWTQVRRPYRKGRRRSKRRPDDPEGTGPAEVRPDRAASQDPCGHRGGPRRPRWRCLRRAQPADAHEYRADRAHPASLAEPHSQPAYHRAEPIPIRRPKRWLRAAIRCSWPHCAISAQLMSLDQLRRDVQVGSPATDIISVSAKGKNAADAEATANAVARSYVAYVSSSNSPVGQVSARQLAPAISRVGAVADEADDHLRVAGRAGRRAHRIYRGAGGRPQ